MKALKIERLFEAAKAAPASVTEPMPEALKIRVLAQWSRESESPLSSVMDLFPTLRQVCRVGLGFAVAVMLACLAWSYSDLTHEPETFVEAATLSAHSDLQL